MTFQIKEQSKGSFESRNLPLPLHLYLRRSSHLVINGVNLIPNKKDSFYSPLLRNTAHDVTAVEVDCKMWRIRQDYSSAMGRRDKGCETVVLQQGFKVVPNVEAR